MTGTISNGEYSDGMYVRCGTGHGYTREYPAPRSLAAIGYAEALLN
ncbi:MAG: hypothetical protein NVSMB2_09970 [Chloroflexota bacterium]